MQAYIHLLKRLVSKADVAIRADRTGVGTHSLFGEQIEFNLQNAFPLLHYRKLPLKSIVAELLWFLEGSTNVERLQAFGCKFWDEWALTEDHVATLPMSPFDRVSYLVKTTNRSEAEVIQHLESLGDMEKGHAYLDELDVPRALEQLLMKKGSIGPMYGAMWRNWKGLSTDRHGNLRPTSHDQLSTLLNDLHERPFSRRHLLTAWNVDRLPDETMSPQENVKAGRMALAPCHNLCQFYVEEMFLAERQAVWNYANPDNQLLLAECHSPEQLAGLLDHHKVPTLKLHCKLTQRSADIILGVPSNIASYALLTHLFAHSLGYAAGRLIVSFGDVHLYSNHMDAAREVIRRADEELQINTTAEYTHHAIAPDVTVVAGPRAQLQLPERDYLTELLAVSPMHPLPVETVVQMIEEIASSVVGYDPMPAIKDIPIAV